VTLECPADTSIAANNMATASDICGSVTITSSDVSIAGCGNTESITRTWTATDECGLAVSCEQIITVVDTMPPFISCPPDVTLECPADTSIAANGTATGSDICGNVAITSSDASVAGCGNTETITRTWTVTDDCGLTSTCDQTITVVDTMAPNISCPVDIAVSNDPGLPSAVVNFVVTAGDLCDPAPAVVCNPTSGTTFPNGTSTVICAATDVCGNTTTCSFNVTVGDTESPIVICPPNTTVVAGAGNQAAVPDLAATGFISDNVTTLANLTISQSPPAGTLVGPGNTTILLKVTDEAGNFAQSTTVLTVIEPTATPTGTATNTATPTSTATPSETASIAPSLTSTDTPTETTTPTSTDTSIATPTATEPVICALNGPCIEAATICIDCTGTFVEAGFLDLVVSLPPFNPITACGPVNCGTPVAVCSVICPASLTVDCTAYAQLLAQELINCINVSMNGFVCATGAGPGKVCIQSASDLTYCLCSSESLVCGPLYHPLEFCPAVNLCDGIIDNENPSNAYTAGLSISYQDKPCPGFVTPTPTPTETLVGPTETATQTQVGVPTSTNTAPAPTNTATPTQTQPVPADSPTPTATQTQPPADTETPTATETNVDTQTTTPTQTETITPTSSQTDAPTRTVTPTPTNTSGVVLTDCDLNGDNRVDAKDLLLLLESGTANNTDILFFARCWYEELAP